MIGYSLHSGPDLGGAVLDSGSCKCDSEVEDAGTGAKVRGASA